MKTFFAVLILFAAAARAQELSPFSVQWPDKVDSPADLSSLHKSPAGGDGFVRIVNGHLARGDGSRLRFWGINCTGKAGLPEKANAPKIAANLARVGINCIRFHFLDRPAPAGIIDAKRDDTRALDPAQLDKLDFFVNELKKRGIYSDLNLNVARGYKKGDGVRDYEYLGFAKSVTYFDPRIVELEKEYARQLLTHRNAYTGNEYRSEPAVAVVELLNENSLIEAWFGGRLIGNAARKNPGTWSDITASYAEALTAKYNDWLKTQAGAEQIERIRREAGIAAGAPVPRLIPNQFAKASVERFETEAAFYMDVEREFVLDMQKFLRDELKLKALLIANSDHGHGKTGYPQLSATSLLDVVDGHVYWQHPNYMTDPSTGRTTGFQIPNTPMVDDPAHSTVVQLARSAFAGKPYTVSEVNHPFPAEYACEGVPILAAYAAFQDWDGLFWYTLGHDDIGAMKDVIRGHFDFAMDPVKMAELPVGAMLFLRGDVKPAKQTLTRSYSRKQVIESIRLPYSDWPMFTRGFTGAAALEHAVRIASLNADSGSVEASEPQAGNLLASDTSELTWLSGAKRSGLVKIDTPRTQGLIGFAKARGEKTANLSTQIENDFCAITLSALDNQEIARSAKLLLIATARTGNTGMTWNEKRNSLTSWGAGPTWIEVVKGTIVLRGLDGATGVSVQPLDGAGRLVSEKRPASKTVDGWTVQIGATASTSHLVEVIR